MKPTGNAEIDTTKPRPWTSRARADSPRPVATDHHTRASLSHRTHARGASGDITISGASR